MAIEKYRRYGKNQPQPCPVAFMMENQCPHQTAHLDTYKWLPVKSFNPVCFPPFLHLITPSKVYLRE